MCLILRMCSNPCMPSCCVGFIYWLLTLKNSSNEKYSTANSGDFTVLQCRNMEDGVPVLWAWLGLALCPWCCDLRGCTAIQVWPSLPVGGRRRWPGHIYVSDIVTWCMGLQHHSLKFSPWWRGSLTKSEWCYDPVHQITMPGVERWAQPILRPLDAFWWSNFGSQNPDLNGLLFLASIFFFNALITLSKICSHSSTGPLSLRYVEKKMSPGH